MARKVLVREIYFYIVCLIAIVLFIVGIIDTYYGTVDYIKPSTYYYGFDPRITQPEQNSSIDEDKLEELIEKDREQYIANEKLNSLKRLFRGVLLIIIAIPIFSYHWTKAKQLWNLE